MTPAQAPFYHQEANAPDGGVVHWLRAADGVRLRAAHWRQGGKGTVLLFPGRTEYVEKYGPAAAQLRSRGYAMATIDWRGQGLADRLLGDRATGHVRRFGDYQADVAALMDFVRAEGLPEPYFLIAHSMGGAIGLRAIYRNLPVKAVAFSAPMWGIRIHPALRPVAWALSTASRTVGRGHRYAPGTTPETYVMAAPFAGNMLTRDEGMFRFMQRQLRAHPELALGGPSLHWLNTALIECFDLRQRPSPRLPCYTALGLLDRIVDVGAIRQRMARWPGARFDQIPGVEHEVMMEGPAIQTRFFDAATELFDAQRG